MADVFQTKDTESPYKVIMVREMWNPLGLYEKVEEVINGMVSNGYAFVQAVSTNAATVNLIFRKQQ